MLLRVLGSLSLILLLPLGSNGTQPIGFAHRVLISSAGIEEDANTNRVFRYDGTTIPGSAEVFVIPQNLGLAGPRGLRLDADGRLYVISRKTNAVLRYDVTTGAFIDTFVSKGSGGLSGPTSLDFGPQGDLYVNSGLTNEILRYDGMTGRFLEIFVGDDPDTPNKNEAGGLQVPRGLVFGPDKSGDDVPDLYVSSRDSDEILLYDGMTGMFLRAFVTDNEQTRNFDERGGLDHPTGLTFGPDHHLYVNSFDTNQVLRYDSDGVFRGVFVTSDELVEPVGITFGPGPTLYVSSFRDNEVLSYDATGTFLNRVVSNDLIRPGDETEGLQSAAELLFDAAGNLWVSSFGGNRVLSYDSMGTLRNTVAPWHPLEIDEPAGPTGMALDPSGNLYIANSKTKRILRYDGETGGFIGVFVWDDPNKPGDETGGLKTPAGLAFDSSGHLYVSSVENDRVLRYGPTGEFMDIFVANRIDTAVDDSGGLAEPIGVAFDAVGNAYVSSRGTGSVLRYDATGKFLDRLVPDGTLAAPTELAFAPDGVTLYISESGANAIWRFDTVTGALDRIVADNDENGGLDTPRGLGVSADGSLVVNSSGNDQVLRYHSTNGLFLEVLLENAMLPEDMGRLDRPVALLFLPPVAPAASATP